MTAVWYFLTAGSNPGFLIGSVSESDTIQDDDEEQKESVNDFDRFQISLSMGSNLKSMIEMRNITARQKSDETTLDTT